MESGRCEIADHGGADRAGDDARGADGGRLFGRAAEQRLIGPLKLGTERRAGERHLLAAPAEIEPGMTMPVDEFVKVFQLNPRLGAFMRLSVRRPIRSAPLFLSIPGLLAVRKPRRSG